MHFGVLLRVDTRFSLSSVELYSMCEVLRCTAIMLKLPFHSWTLIEFSMKPSLAIKYQSKALYRVLLSWLEGRQFLIQLGNPAWPSTVTPSCREEHSLYHWPLFKELMLTSYTLLNFCVCNIRILLFNHQNQQDDGEKKEDNEAAFNAWCDAKREQQKKERLLKSREQKERDDAYFIRSRDECEAAFKRYVDLYFFFLNFFSGYLIAVHYLKWGCLRSLFLIRLLPLFHRRKADALYGSFFYHWSIIHYSFFFLSWGIIQFRSLKMLAPPLSTQSYSNGDFLWGYMYLIFISGG